MSVIMREVSKMQVYYLIDLKAKQVHIYVNWNEAKKKENELTEKYGLRSIELPTGYIFEAEPVRIQYTELKHYYGTVWLAYKWEDGHLHYKIEGRWKEIMHWKDTMEIKKIVFKTYKEYMKQFRD